MTGWAERESQLLTAHPFPMEAHSQAIRTFFRLDLDLDNALVWSDVANLPVRSKPEVARALLSG
jgi:hypothetical protein